jgi:hypothetical protein
VERARILAIIDTEVGYQDETAREDDNEFAECVSEVLGGLREQIAQTVAGRSQGYFELKEGSLYPALHRLERQRLLASFWEEADNRRRKYYKLTAAGQKALAARKQEWQAFSTGVNSILGTAYGLV